MGLLISYWRRRFETFKRKFIKVFRIFLSTKYQYHPFKEGDRVVYVRDFVEKNRNTRHFSHTYYKVARQTFVVRQVREDFGYVEMCPEEHRITFYADLDDIVLLERT